MSSSEAVDTKLTQSCRQKYPHMVPITVEAQHGITLHKNKFLISENLSGLEVQRNILKFAEREINQSLFFFIVDKKRHRMLQNTVLVKDVYQLYHDGRGFLNIKIMKENVF